MVAESRNAGSSESIRYDGSAGYYLWQILSRSGGGAYTFTLNRP